MIQEELDLLKKSYSFPSGVEIRLPEGYDTIASTRLSEVTFYEAAFHADLRLPIHPIIERIIYFYNA